MQAKTSFNDTPKLSQWRWLILLIVTVLYALAAAWAAHQWPIVTQDPAQTPAVHFVTGAIDGIFLTALLPVTILTPAIILWVALRAPTRWLIASVATAVVACGIGADLGSAGPQEFSPFWSVIILLTLNVPILGLLTIMITVTANGLRKRVVRKQS